MRRLMHCRAWRGSLLLLSLGLFACSAERVWADDLPPPLPSAQDSGQAAAEPPKVEFADPLGVVLVAWPPIGDAIEHKEREVAPTPGVSREIRFTQKEGEGPAAVLVASRIRDDLPKDDRVLERIEPKYKAFKEDHPNDVVVEFRGESPARTLEVAVAGGEYQEMFPFVIGGPIGVDNPPKSITISQFYVDSGRMFEMALYLPNDDQSTRDALFARAREKCDQWRAGVAVKQ